jgi:RNA polymerase sigma factor (sigma-70 family)
VTDSDASLVARVVADDDHSAFELLVRRHQSPLRNFLRKLARYDIERADDLAQETFIKAYRAIHTYKGTVKFSSWLFRIAYTTFLNDERSRYPEVEFNQTQHLPVEGTSKDADIVSDIDRALQHLSVRQQAVFDLQYKKGMTHSEIADTLDLPLGTVKSDRRRGLEMLKQHLRDWRRS